MADGRHRDAALIREFHTARARAGQQREQSKAGVEAEKDDKRRDAFRERLGALLARDAYSHLDGATKERLLAEIPPVAFPPKGLEL
jgi:hypothetical protein